LGALFPAVTRLGAMPQDLSLSALGPQFTYLKEDSSLIEFSVMTALSDLGISDHLASSSEKEYKRFPVV
jgi:hypothetical protein